LTACWGLTQGVRRRRRRPSSKLIRTDGGHISAHSRIRSYTAGFASPTNFAIAQLLRGSGITSRGSAAQPSLPAPAAARAERPPFARPARDGRAAAERPRAFGRSCPAQAARAVLFPHPASIA